MEKITIWLNKILRKTTLNLEYANNVLSNSYPCLQSHCLDCAVRKLISLIQCPAPPPPPPRIVTLHLTLVHH